MPAGGYLLDRFLITLDQGNHVINSATNSFQLPIDPQKFSIFFHEYSHYLQNISTLSGFSHFSTELDLWWLFRETVDRNTLVSAGSGILSAQRRGWIQLYTTLWQTSLGSIYPVQGPLPNAAQFTVRTFHVQATNVPLVNGIATRSLLEIHGTAVDGTTGHPIPVTFQFGTDALTEGLAALLQEKLALGLGGQAPILPVFPYEVLRSLASHIAAGIDEYSLAMLATLALQSNDPVQALHGMLLQWANDPDVPNRLANIVAIEVPDTTAKITTILLTDIPRLRGAFTGAGEIGRGIVTVIGRFEDALKHRVQYPFFDIDAAFSPGPGARVPFALLNRHPACLVLQESSNQAPDELFEFGPPAAAQTDALSVLHSAFQFYFAHLRVTTFAPTGQIQTQICPFFSSCQLPLRNRDPQICQTKPWDGPHWQGWGGPDRCWYSRGVASSAF